MGISRLKPNVAGGAQWDFECGEALNAGDPIYIYDDSGAKVKKVFTALGNIGDFGKTYYNDSCLIGPNKIVVVYRDYDNANKATVRCGTVNADETITWGSSIVYYNAYGYYLSVSKVDTDKFVVISRGTGNYAAAWIGSVAGTVITMGSEYQLSAGAGYDTGCCQLASGKFVACWRDAGVLNHVMSRVGVVTGLTIALGTTVQVTTTTAYSAQVASAGVDDKFVITYRRSDGSPRGMIRCSTVTGSAIDGYGAEVRYTDAYATYGKVTNVSLDKVAVIYGDSSDGNKPKVIVGTLSGTAPVFDQNDIVQLNDETTYRPDIIALDSSTLICGFSDGLTPYRGLVSRCLLSGTTLTPEPLQCFSNGLAYYITLCVLDSNRYVLVWYGNTTAKSYYLAVEGDLNMLANTMGLMRESGGMGEIKPIDLLGGISEQLSGMIPGAIQYIQCDASISGIHTPYPIGIALAADKMLIHKSPFG